MTTTISTDNFLYETIGEAGARWHVSPEHAASLIVSLYATDAAARPRIQGVTEEVFWRKYMQGLPPHSRDPAPPLVIDLPFKFPQEVAGQAGSVTAESLSRYYLYCFAEGTYTMANLCGNANMYMWAADLQRWRMEEKDDDFQQKVITDFYFLVAALWRVRDCAKLGASRFPMLHGLQQALRDFDGTQRELKYFRDVLEHMADYIAGHGNMQRDQSQEAFPNSMLRVSMYSDGVFYNLGKEFRVDPAIEAATHLFEALVQAKKTFCDMPQKSNRDFRQVL